MDGVPVLSQIKSLAQWATGNGKGALETQKNFYVLCPVVSQCTSLAQAIFGDDNGALETQKQFLKGVESMVNCVPVVGHVKGAVHYICGDKEGGDNAIKAASRTTGVIGGGAVGFMLGGPVGAAVGGVEGGMLMDSIITIGDIAVNGQNAKPYGIIDNVTRVVEDPTDGGNYVDLIGGIASDAVTGYIAGKGIGEKIKYNCNKAKLAKTVGNEAATDIVDAGESTRKIHSKIKIKRKTPHVSTIAKDRVTGRTAVGHNRQMRNVLKNHHMATNQPTELEIRVPGAKKVIDRRFDSCAEHQAYNGIYRERPDAKPSDLSSVSVKWDEKSNCPKTVKGCDNCQQFKPAMGDVYTDLLPETAVPRRVRFSKAVNATALGVTVHALTKEQES